MAKDSFSVDCNSCGFHKTADTEDGANAVAAQHAASVHGGSAAGHFLGNHVKVTATKPKSEK